MENEFLGNSTLGWKNTGFKLEIIMFAKAL